MTLVFVTMFAVIFGSLAGLVSRTYHESVLQAQDETAFQIAESGLNYARWRLAHDSDNFTTEGRTVTDQFAGTLGSFQVTFVPPPAGGTVTTITAVGRTAQQPSRQVTLVARYGKSSLAEYAAITNNDAWYGGTINGAVHANGGVRMDGTSDSLITSAKETYPCQPYHGCTSPYQTKPGVWGAGQEQELWEFPVPPIDYNALTADLLAMKEAAIAANTYYGPSGKFGYQIVFNSNNTYTISKVKKKGPAVWSAMYEPDWQWKNESHDVDETQSAHTENVPANGVIFVEDMLWVRGDIRDRVTVAAGVFPEAPATNVDIILNGSITYGGVVDGSRAFAAVAQRHVLIPWSGAADIMRLDGAFVAQKGSFHRRYYPNCCGTQTHALKTSLTRYGMVASNAVPGTAWVDGSGVVISGFRGGTAAYDPNFRYAPPPYFPTSGQYEFISWEEQQ